MPSLPTPDQLRVQLASLDQRQKKIIAGMLSVMVQNADRVRDREWISEQFTQVTLLAGGFDEEGEAHGGLEEVQEFLQDNIGQLLNIGFALFAQVAADMALREDFNADDAVTHGMSFF
jgi:hypothetical protein